jgi:protocatechuate 3,4-dioxygenase beta subunit
MRRPGILLISLVAGLLLRPSVAPGQVVNVSTGVVEGRVTDSTGAVLAGVTIEVSGDALMRPRQTYTDMEGFYRFPALPPGEYTHLHSPWRASRLRTARVFMSVSRSRQRSTS